MRVALVALTALTGCSKILGIADVTRSDAGTVDAPLVAPPNTVIGHAYTHYQMKTGTFDEPRDLSGVSIKAYIPDGSAAGFQVVAGAGAADGTFSIFPVPDGVEYYLQIDRNFYVTSQHVIDHHFEPAFRGSPSPENATLPTTLSFNLTNLTPYTEGPNLIYDELPLVSFAGLYTGYLLGVHNGSPSIVVDYDWSSGYVGWGTGAPLPDAAQEDDVWLQHIRPNVVAGFAGRKHENRTLLDIYQVDPLTLANGATVTKTGVATQVTPGAGLQLSFQRGPFDAGYDGTTAFADAHVYLGVNPVAAAFAGAELGTMSFSDWSRSTNLTEIVSFAYGDPFPASWARMMTISYTRFRYMLFPGTTVYRPLSGFMRRTFVFMGGTPSLLPTLSPPGNVKIATQLASAGGKIAFDGTAPITVTWSGVAQAKLYQVSVYRIYANGSQTKNQVNGIFYTTGTQVTIPADVFSGGEFFGFIVDAVQSSNDYGAGVLVPTGLPFQEAATSSAMFRLSATCGNGTPDIGESCDSGAASASCDVDCTPPMCGDALLNTAAGETCDTGKDTPSCDSDCTTPSCGDGHLNLAAGEDCDDGNSVDNANGCTANCKLSSMCGDSVTQIGEACDPGGVDTAGCDSDCSPPVCGDGHRNAAAGEACDDGNSDEADGCKSNCQP